MKNKEIEELLNKFKNADSQQFNELVEDFDNVYKLLSYIEQLENNRDKAIEEIQAIIENFITNHTDQYLDWKYDEKIYRAETSILSKLYDEVFNKIIELKGDSE